MHKSSEKVGRPPVLSMAEEQVFVERLQLMGSWGYPLDPYDFRILVKDYLDREGRTTRNMSLKSVPIPTYLKVPTYLPSTYLTF